MTKVSGSASFDQAKVIFAILASIMHLDAARNQALSTNFMQNFVYLATTDWSRRYDRKERAQLAASTFKTLRLLTDDRIFSARVAQEQPTLLT